MKKLRVLDLFSGIGGFSLGLERTGGFETVAFCEIEDYPRRVLAKHWPKVPIYDDVRTLTAVALRRDGIAVDVICGGFPCQDISFAGAGAGLAGERSGLWREYARLIGELRPRFVIVENVSALLGRGLGAVLGDMAALGYDAEWHCIPASAVGAPHRRDRIWIVAYPGGEQHEGDCAAIGRALAAQLHAADATSGGPRCDGEGCEQEPASGTADLADAEMVCIGTGLRKARTKFNRTKPCHCGRHVGDTKHSGREGWDTEWSRAGSAVPSSWWAIEPDVGRMVARLSSWLDGGRLENADACEGITAEILRMLQQPDGAKALRWEVGGFVGVQAAQILLAAVCEYEGTAKPLGNVSLESEGASRGALRGLWFDGSIACPSCRWSATEQRTSKYPDAMRVVSQLLACDCRSAWLDRAGSTGTVRGVDRLRGLGNAVVPQIPELIGQAILQTLDQEQRKARQQQTFGR